MAKYKFNSREELAQAANQIIEWYSNGIKSVAEIEKEEEEVRKAAMVFLAKSKKKSYSGNRRGN